MAVSSPRQISGWSACSAPTTNDLVLMQGNTLANTFNITITTLFGNNDVNHVVDSAAALVVSNTSTPADSDDGGFTNNSIWFSNDFIYCVQSNGYIKRAALSTF